jgi:hypothetical protein
MKIDFVYKIFPTIIIYKSWGVKKKFAGTTYGPVIFIREEYRNDKALLEHEKTHAKQWYRTLSLHSILYMASKRYRLEAEVEAYKKTMEVNGYVNEYQYEWIVDTLRNNYGLEVSREEILKKLNTRE